MRIKISTLKCDRESLITVSFVIILFIRSYILRDSEAFNYGYIRLGLTLMTWFCIFLITILHFINAEIKIYNSRLSFVLCVLFYFLYRLVWSYQYFGLDITNALVCLLIVLQKDSTKRNVYLLFKWIVVIEAFIGIIIFFIHILPFISMPHIIAERGAGSGTYFANYFLSYILLDVNGQIRLCGLFDEPGYFATFIAFFLCADNLNIRKKENLILFIAGVLSFSMSYYFLLGTYYVMENMRQLKKWIPLLIVMLSVFLLLPKIRTGNENIDHNLIRLSRLLSSEKNLSLNGSRYDARFASIVEEITNDEKLLLLGYGSGFVSVFKELNNTVAETFLVYIVDYGIIGTALIFVPLLIVVLKRYKSNIQVIMYTIITFASLFQRPYFYTISYFMMFICGLAYVEENKLMKLRENQIISENNLRKVKKCVREA